MKDTIWIVNKSNTDFENTDIDLKRHIVIKPLIPVPLPGNIAIKYAQKYQTLFICDNPEKYYTGTRKFNQLIIRDAGIGDLLLLEPIIRTLAQKNKKISVLSQFPDVFFNHPGIKNNLQMQEKGILNINLNDFDAYEDLRNYSEQCVNRDTRHRTDCYNQRFDLKLTDKEPRLYFLKDEKSKIKKNSKHIYIGLQCDASHVYRKYEKGETLIDYLLKKDERYIVVVFGDERFVNVKKHRRILDLQGKTSIREAINIIRILDYMIGIDSGLVHVALTLHVPTVAIMSIISPELRLKYYTGPHEILTKNIDCIGCGNKHMIECKFGNKKINKNFIPPCLDIVPEEIYEKLMLLEVNDEKRLFFNDEKIENQKENNMKINVIHNHKLKMPIIVLNEEENLPRFIDLVIKHPAIGEVIAIDGGSTDRTVELLKKAGAKVYMHYYDPGYHDMQALQRNVSCSFVKDGEKILIMDIDECFSNELNEYLPFLIESNIDYGLISRKTFDYFKDINDSSKSIKDYPDYQPRFFTWNKKYKWIGSPHHNVFNVPQPVKINKDIIHFEKEGKDRNVLERQWADMEKASKEIYL